MKRKPVLLRALSEMFIGERREIEPTVEKDRTEFESEGERRALMALFLGNRDVSETDNILSVKTTPTVH